MAKKRGKGAISEKEMDYRHAAEDVRKGSSRRPPQDKLAWIPACEVR